MIVLLGDDGAEPDQAPKSVKNDKLGAKGGKSAPPPKPATTQRDDRPARGGDRGDRGGNRGRGDRRGGERGGMYP
jgi:hypothetical protein